MINKDILADLDDLDEGSEQDNAIEEELNEDDGEGNHEVKLQQYGVTNIAAQKHSRLLTVNREKFIEHMNKISQRIDDKITKAELGVQEPSSAQNNEQLIEQINKSNQYAMQINRQTASITKYIKQIYNKIMPQLESIVTNEKLYCRSILEIEEQANAGMIQQEAKQQAFKYLTPHQRISLKICMSSSRSTPSREDQLEVIAAAKVVVELQNHYDVLMMFLETSMQAVAPNLCQLVGSVIASKLIATAGGIDKLAAMPACNIQVMGGNRNSQVGFSQMERNHTGVFGQMDVVRDAPKKFQMQLVRMLATNAAKCARADYLGSNNGQGAKLRDEMYDRFEKVQQQGGLMRQQKPMDIPDMKPKKKRGGKRHRKQKQLYQMSELRKQQNRIKFGQQAQEQIDEGVGLGMLKAGIGKLKVNIKKQKLKVSKKMEQRANKKSGLESTLNLSAHQGIQLINPALKEEKGKGTQSYFSKQAGFRTVLHNKLGK